MDELERRHVTTRRSEVRFPPVGVLAKVQSLDLLEQ
jgi:hypothetical protein